MAPKQDPADSAKTDVALLCNILMSVPELKLDNKSLATILGLSSPKNVLRSLNSRLKPYGFEYKAGKIIQIGQEPGEASTATSSPNAGDAAAAAASDTDKAKAPKTPKTPKTTTTKKATGAASSTTKTPASKKRKVEEAVEESDNAAEDAADVSVKDEGKDSDVEE